jgi:hypothetical protein
MATVLVAGLNNPVVASPERCGFVADADVPRVMVLPPQVPQTIAEPLDCRHWLLEPYDRRQKLLSARTIPDIA